MQLIGRILVWQIPGISDASRCVRIHIQKYTHIHKATFQMFGYFVILFFFFYYYRHCVVMRSNHKPWGMHGPMNTMPTLSRAVELREGLTPCVTQASLEAVSLFPLPHDWSFTNDVYQPKNCAYRMSHLQGESGSQEFPSSHHIFWAIQEESEDTHCSCQSEGTNHPSIMTEPVREYAHWKWVYTLLPCKARGWTIHRDGAC